MKSLRLNQQHQRLSSLFEKVREIGSDNPEMQAHWARYLCVLVSGFLENAIVEVYSEYAKRCANTNVYNYTQNILASIKNPKAEKFRLVAGAFNKRWGEELSLFLDVDGRGDAINAIISNRHLIAHHSCPN